MNKIKIKNKSGVSQLVIKSIKGQQINENEVYYINSNKIDGLLHLDVLSKGKKFQLIYNITGYIPMKDYLITPLNKERFAKILQSILSCLKSMEKSYFNLKYLLLDFNRIMVNPATQNIYFVYVPIQFFETKTTLKDFLLDIIRFSTFVMNEDTNYVKEYISILNNGINFSVFDLEQYVQKLLDVNNENTHDVCYNCKKNINKNSDYCSNCGTKIIEKTIVGNKGIYNPLDVKENMPIYEKPSAKEIFNAATMLDHSSRDTTVSNLSGYNEVKRPYLVRKSTDEKIYINDFPFKIGKDENVCNYTIPKNTISRKHAQITTKDNRFYVVDLCSTNKTYIDGKIIPSNIEVEIFEGMCLKFADENFYFYI